MFRILAVFIIAFTALFSGANQASADHNAYTTADVNMRTGPGPRYPVILTIPQGESVHVHTCLTYPNWCDVSWYGHRGFVYRRYLDGLAPKVYRDYVYPPPYVYPPRYVYPPDYRGYVYPRYRYSPYFRYERDWYPDRYHEPRKERKKYKNKKKRHDGYKKKRKSGKKWKKGSNKKKKKAGNKERRKKSGKNKKRR